MLIAFFLFFRARRLRKVLGGGMRQSGILAAAGLIALKTAIPRLREDHKHTRAIADAIYQINSPNFQVDLENVHSNILLIQIKSKRIAATDFCERLQSVTKKELLDEVTTIDGRAIVVKAGARDWSYTRIVLYNQITDQDVKYSIRKIVYVIQEYDRNIAAK